MSSSNSNQVTHKINKISLPFRLFKISSVVFFFIFQAYLTLRLVFDIPTYLNSAFSYIAAALTAFISYVASDLVSGVVHFLCDNFGSAKTRFLGKSFILPFRIHHDDPLDITRHDFIHTNAHNCFVLLPLIAPISVFLPFHNLWLYLIGLFVWGFSLGIFGTNQFHKWAHLPNPSAPIRFLQKCHLILPSNHHGIHHTSPFDTYYCITTGWLNPIIQKSGICERIVKKFKKTSKNS